MRKRIIVEKEVREKIRKVFKVSNETIFAALRFQTKSELSNKIRKMAIENGGKIFGEIRDEK